MFQLLFCKTDKKGFDEIQNFIPTAIITLCCLVDAIGKLRFLLCFIPAYI